MTELETKDLIDRVAIVTGAGKGIGRAYALDLAKRGAAVVVNNHRHVGEKDEETSAAKLVAEIRAAGGRAVENYDSVESAQAGHNMVNSAISEFGRLDIVIANAAMTQAATFSRIELDDFKQIFDVSFLGTLHLLHAAWDAMKEQQYGRIVTTTSSAGRYGNHGLSAYGSAKAAVEVLTRSLAFEGEKYNVKVNAVSPYALTQMTEAHMSADVAARFQADRITPLVSWLASEQCSVTGEVFVAAAGRIRRAYNVETESIALDQDDVKSSVNALFAKIGQPHPSSNTAFASLVKEVEKG